MTFVFVPSEMPVISEAGDLVRVGVRCRRGVAGRRGQKGELAQGSRSVCGWPSEEHTVGNQGVPCLDVWHKPSSSM